MHENVLCKTLIINIFDKTPVFTTFSNNQLNTKLKYLSVGLVKIQNSRTFALRD